MIGLRLCSFQEYFFYCYKICLSNRLAHLLFNKGQKNLVKSLRLERIEFWVDKVIYNNACMTEHGLAGVEIGFFFTLSAKTGYESKFVPK